MRILIGRVSDTKIGLVESGVVRANNFAVALESRQCKDVVRFGATRPPWYQRSRYYTYQLLLQVERVQVSSIVCRNTIETDGTG